MVAGLTAADVLLAWTLLGFFINTVVNALLLILALASAAAYNYLICNFIEKLRADV